MKAGVEVFCCRDCGLGVRGAESEAGVLFGRDVPPEMKMPYSCRGEETGKMGRV